jgi:hypothetical protein
VDAGRDHGEARDGKYKTEIGTHWVGEIASRESEQVIHRLGLGQIFAVDSDHVSLRLMFVGSFPQVLRLLIELGRNPYPISHVDLPRS